MKFMGSKARIAKYILPIMLKDRTEHRWWVEPFVGGGNIIERVPGHRIGADVNPNVIKALSLIRSRLFDLPKDGSEFSEKDYRNLRETDSHIKPYAGFAFSYGGKWLGGWRRDSLGKRDYVEEAYKNAQKQSPKIAGVLFITRSYESLFFPANSVVYCDPPYANTTKYGRDFNHHNFWEWCRQKSKEGHKVFISEYQAPTDFEVVWEGKISSSLTKDTGSKVGVEKLFVYSGV